MTTVMVAAARRLGEAAARLGRPMTSCPYQQGITPEQDAAARAWVEAYLRWQPTAAAAISYDDEPDTGGP